MKKRRVPKSDLRDGGGVWLYVVPWPFRKGDDIPLFEGYSGALYYGRVLFRVTYFIMGKYWSYP